MAIYSGHKDPGAKLTSTDSYNYGCNLHYDRRGDQNYAGLVKTTLQYFRKAIDVMAKVVALAEAGKPLFVKINNGAREGSIARLDPSCYEIRTPSFEDKHMRSNLSLVKRFLVPDDHRLTITIMKNKGDAFDHFIQSNGQSWFEIHCQHSKVVAVNLYSDKVFAFDDKKSVRCNWNDMVDLEWLPDYEGPTVSQFTRKANVSKEEKARIEREKRNEIAYTPIDKFGYKLGAGDMFVYGKADDLVLGILVKVTDSAVMVYKPILGGDEKRIMGTYTIESLKKGERIQALMRFEKDEVLSQKLMVEKLKR